MQKRAEYRFSVPKTIPDLRAEAQGLVARFTLVVENGKNDSTLSAWIALEKLYLHAKSILPENEFSLEGEAESWSNMIRLAKSIVAGCDHAEPPAPTDVPGDYGD